MKQFLTLSGSYDGLKVRRLQKFGRVELLRVIEESPYWFVRIAGFNEKRDRSRMVRCGSEFGNGYFRFCHFDQAKGKFAELKAQPESEREEREQQISRDKKRERALILRQSGKLTPFQKDTQKSPKTGQDELLLDESD